MSILSCPLSSHLLPISNFQYGFTTNLLLQSTFLGANVQTGSSASTFSAQTLEYVNLTDEKSLGIIKVASSQLGHPVVKPPPETDSTANECCSTNFDFGPPSETHLSSNIPLPPPELAWEAFYPSGSINPSGPVPGGFGFYLNGTKEFADRMSNGATEIVMGYLMLESGWEWVKGGKLPGVFGGIDNQAYGCSGGRQDARDACFDARLMWRADAAGELYTYFPLTQDNAERLLTVPPQSVNNTDYGISAGRGSFTLPVGRWMSVAIRMKLNQVGVEDGKIEVFIDGLSVISVSGLTLSTTEDSKFKGMHFQTFFGGSRPDWASPKDQHAWFADVTGVVVR
ncbi:hypothetical protein D9757_000900 [Collybiopsis confluens]|uniref:Polysaccharide lyase 14 domain-containing protein n=1 Tax=Collybiopsis confluens TaxID=2823264 RepID=A0A8H5MG67_9AGAR|nr:hypothetical protein D9757_000900 [Collybiopsis confluens]